MKSPPSIRVESIPEEGLTLTLALDTAWLASVLSAADMRPADDVHASARIRLDENRREVIVSGDVACTAIATCGACLEDMALALGSTFQLVLEPAEAKRPPAHPTDVELSASELDADVYDDGTIDLAHWLREQILLEAPVYPRHEGTCPRPLVSTTTPTHEGTTRSIDPRLAPLLTLSRKE
jgi:uncharacterized metal-binding protein YceD (DUF177 family)